MQIKTTCVILELFCLCFESILDLKINLSKSEIVPIESFWLDDVEVPPKLLQFCFELKVLGDIGTEASPEDTRTTSTLLKEGRVAVKPEMSLGLLMLGCCLILVKGLVFLCEIMGLKDPLGPLITCPFHLGGLLNSRDRAPVVFV